MADAALPAREIEDGRYRYALMIGLALCSVAIVWYAFTIGILLPDISRDLRLSHSQGGFLSGSYFVGQLLFVLPASAIVSRFNPVRVMALVFALSTVLLVVAASVPNYYAQIAVRFTVAVLFVCINPVRAMLIGALFRGREVTSANSIFNGAFGVVQGGAYVVAGALLEAAGSWRATIAVFAVVSAAGAAAWTLLGRGFRVTPHAPEPPRDGGRAPSMLAVVRRRDVRFMAVAAAGGGGTWATYLTFWPSYAADALGLSDARAGFVMATASVATIPGYLLAPRLLRLVRRRRMLLVAAMALQIPSFALTLVTGNVALLFAVAVAQGMLWFYWPLLLSVPFQLPGMQQRDIVMATGFFVLVNSAAQAGAPAVAGLAADAFPSDPCSPPRPCCCSSRPRRRRCSRSRSRTTGRWRPAHSPPRGRPRNNASRVA